MHIISKNNKDKDNTDNNKTYRTLISFRPANTSEPVSFKKFWLSLLNKIEIKNDVIICTRNSLV